MIIPNEYKMQIQKVVSDSLSFELQKFKAKDNFMPFHFRLLGKDRLLLYSFMQSLLTTFGTSVFEPIAAALNRQASNTIPKLTTILESLINKNPHKMNKVIEISDLYSIDSLPA
jgi:hypothetical protein